jgi:antirestriction protein ArdC
MFWYWGCTRRRSRLPTQDFAHTSRPKITNGRSTGERGTTVFLYKPLEIEDDKSKNGVKVIPLLKTFTVFHPTQMTGVPPFVPPKIEECPWQSDEATSIILKNSGVTVRIGGDKAFYSPSTDHIQVPPSVAFKNAAREATVRLHELGHATGAKHRLNRDLEGRFGSRSYSFEELVAELSSAFIGNVLNIPADIEIHASYIANWLTILRGDKRAIFQAAALAQNAADWILCLHPNYCDALQPPRFPAP